MTDNMIQFPVDDSPSADDVIVDTIQLQRDRLRRLIRMLRDVDRVCEQWQTGAVNMQDQDISMVSNLCAAAESALYIDETD
jgi:hypothetical protein